MGLRTLHCSGGIGLLKCFARQVRSKLALKAVFMVVGSVSASNTCGKALAAGQVNNFNRPVIESVPEKQDFKIRFVCRRRPHFL